MLQVPDPGERASDGRAPRPITPFGLPRRTPKEPERLNGVNHRLAERGYDGPMIDAWWGMHLEVNGYLTRTEMWAAARYDEVEAQAGGAKK
jgi:hypothetical protein